MALAKSRIQALLQPYLTLYLPKEVIDSLVEEDYLEIFNQVAEDLNSRGYLNVERFYKTASTDTAEDSDVTNFLLQGEIEKILDFKYHDDDWEEVRYTYSSDRLALKETADGVLLDIHYLRRPEEITIATDEIDLPHQVLPEYLELLKIRFRKDYGDMGDADYEERLIYYAEKARRKIQRPVPMAEVRRSWFQQTGDDHVYVVEPNQYIGLENFVTGVDGNLTYTGE